jgi:cyclopropane fatty-acyl-phospholipid synthase-like methyltransferase
VCLGAGASEVFCLEVDAELIEMGKQTFREMGICSCRYTWVDVRTMDPKAFPRFDIVYSRAVFMHIPFTLVEAYWRWTAERLKDDGEAHFQLFEVDGRTEFHNGAVRMPDFDAERRMRDCGLEITARREIRHQHMEPVWTIYELKKAPV